ncbi:MAG: hypothetical protein QOG63_1229, partial [Thermoleophilaceae bacterium]|nr:hypothetical protein [Thermoleophilaceae bacterium]
MGVKAVVAAIALALAVTAPGAFARTVRGSVRFIDHHCYADTVERWAPLTGAEVVLHRGKGRPVRTRLDHEGKFKAKVRGHGPLLGRLVFTGPRIKVVPSSEGAPQALHLAGLRSAGPNHFSLRSESQAGLAHLWTEANRAAHFAAKAAPVDPGQVTYVWAYGRSGRKRDDLHGSGTTGRTVYMNGGDSGRHEWEAFVIAHEYGHVVLAANASPGEAGGEHQANLSYPEYPALGWSEGFANAYASLVARSPSLTVGCEEVANYSVTPPRPALKTPRYAQSNETAVAAATLLLVDRFGGGAEGLHKLLATLRNGKVDGHFAHSMWEVREALIASGVEHNAKQHREFDDLFASVGMGWGEGIAVDVSDDRREGMGARSRLHLLLSGPYGSCEVTDESQSTVGTPWPTAPEGRLYGAVVAGALDYTYLDDCVMQGGPNSIPPDGGETHVPFTSFLGGVLSLPFPYPAQSGGDDSYTL